MGAVIGIDLGTTNTVVAAVRDGKAVALPDESGSTLIPSIVSFLPSGAVLVGNAAHERRSEDVRNTIYSVKRLIGRTWDSDEVNQAKARLPFELREGPGRATFVIARGETYTLPEISAFVLRKAKSIAELELGEPVDRAVITVPANFNDLQRAATKVAGRVAGLEVLRIINEPTAAALAFGHTRGDAKCIAVYDLGGGTFDFTLLRLTADVFEVLATAGDTFLGGDDIDAEIVGQMADRFIAEGYADPREQPEGLERLRNAAEQLKHSLTTEPDASVRLSELGLAEAPAVNFLLTRRDLDAATRTVVERSIAICKEALGSAKLSLKDVEDVLLVGGSTKDPYVRRRVAEFFGKPARADVDPHEVVAVGAAQHAMTLTQLRATASGIPVPPPPHAPQPDVPSFPKDGDFRQKTEPFGRVPTAPMPIGTEPSVAAQQKLEAMEAIAALPQLKVKIAPPDGPAAAPAPSTKDLIHRERRTTGLGIGPAASPAPDGLPLVGFGQHAPVEPGPPTPASREAASPPSTISGLGPKGANATTVASQRDVDLPVAKSPATPQVVAREPTGRVSSDATQDRTPEIDFSQTLSSEVGRPPQPRIATTPKTDPFGSAVLDAPALSKPRPPAKPQFVSPPASAAKQSQLAERASSPITSLSAANSDEDGWGDLPETAPKTPITPTQAQQRRTAPQMPSVGREFPQLPLVVPVKPKEPTPLVDAELPADLPAAVANSSAWDPLPEVSERKPFSPAKPPHWKDLLSQSDELSDSGEDDTTAVRRSSVDLEQPPTNATLNSELPGILQSSPQAAPRSRRPVSLNEEEIRARYGNLPLIVGGKRVGVGPQVPRGDVSKTASGNTPPPPVELPEAPKPTASPVSPAAPAQQYLSLEPQALELESENQAPKALPLEPLSLEPEELEPRSSRPAKGRYLSSRPAARLDASLEADLPIPDVPSSSRRAPVSTPQPASAPTPAAGPPRATAPVSAAVVTKPARVGEEPRGIATAPFAATLAMPRLPETPLNQPAPWNPNGFGLGAAVAPLGTATSPVAQLSPNRADTAALTAAKTAVPNSSQLAKATALAGTAVGSTAASLVGAAALRPPAGPALLIDVTPLSLCVETAGGYTDVLVARNTPVPCERTRDFVTVQNNQEAVVVRVAQGESTQFQENVLLGEVQLSKLTAAPRGQTRISITFSLDSDGILHVRAQDVATGQAAIADLQLVGAASSPEVQHMTARNRTKGA